MRIIAPILPEPEYTASDWAYVDAVAARTFTVLAEHLRTVCPECGVEPAGTDEASAHALTDGGHVVIGCEGYWVIDPAALGMERGDWTPPVPGPAEQTHTRLDTGGADGARSRVGEPPRPG